MKVDQQLSDDDDRERRRQQYRTTAKHNLEALAVSAIKQHRQLFQSDQAVYEEWQRASEATDVPTAVVQSLQIEYLRRRGKTAAQQQLLSDLLDVLGYVPELPDGDDALNSTIP